MSSSVESKDKGKGWSSEKCRGSFEWLFEDGTYSVLYFRITSSHLISTKDTGTKHITDDYESLVN